MNVPREGNCAVSGASSFQSLPVQGKNVLFVPSAGQHEYSQSSLGREKCLKI